MTTRRAFLASASGLAGTAALGVPALTAFHPRAADLARELKKHGGQPAEVAENEAFWVHVARAFTVDRSVINLNNGSVSP